MHAIDTAPATAMVAARALTLDDVSNTNGVYLLAFDIQPNGIVRNRRNFGTYEGRSRFPNGIPGTMTGADGITIDSEGRMYGLSAAGVEIFDPHGAHLGIIPMSCGGLDCQAPTLICRKHTPPGFVDRLVSPVLLPVADRANDIRCRRHDNLEHPACT